MKWGSILLLCMLVLTSASCNKEPDPVDQPQDKPAPEILLTTGETKVSSTGNLLAFEFLEMITREEVISGKKENIMISPLSLNLAMAMAWNGATGNTKDQIKEALGFVGDTDQDVNSFFKKMTEALPEADALSKIMIANSIWYDKPFPVKPSFLQTNRDWFNAVTYDLDFGNTQESLNAINSWCSQKTNGMIEKILDKISENEVMFLINALYFKAPWKNKFDPSKTAPMTFTLENGESINVPAMSGDITVNYFYGSKFNSATLPFGNGAFKMTLIVPGEGMDIQKIYSEIGSPGTWDNIVNSKQSSKLKVYLPKFKFGYKIEFNDMLKSLGITDAFNENATFGGIADFPTGNLRISKVLQKTAIEINEEGGEASAVTSVGFDLTSAGPEKEFRANKPFLFIIWEQSTGTILFAGKVENPTAPSLG